MKWTQELMFRAIVAGLLVALFAFAVWFVVIRPGQAEERARRASVEAEEAKGQAAAAEDAAGVIIGNAQDGLDTRKKVDADVKDLHDIEDEQRGALAVARMCMYDSAKDDPRCVQLRRERSRGVEGGRP